MSMPFCPKALIIHVQACMVSTTRVKFLKDLELRELAMLPLTLKWASVSEDSSIGDRNRRRFFLR